MVGTKEIGCSTLSTIVDFKLYPNLYMQWRAFIINLDIYDRAWFMRFFASRIQPTLSNSGLGIQHRGHGHIPRSLMAAKRALEKC
jgi:hypothetical protein